MILYAGESPSWLDGSISYSGAISEQLTRAAHWNALIKGRWLRTARRMVRCIIPTQFSGACCTPLVHWQG